MTKLMSVSECLAMIKKLQAQATFAEPQDILRMPDQFVTEWQAGVQLGAGRVVLHEGVKYLVLQAVATLESQLPSDTGMLAVYKPYTDASCKEWIYGEYVESGWQRVFDGVTYTAIQDAGANIFSPDLVPAIWEAESEVLD